MSRDPRFGPIPIVVSRPNYPPVTLRLKQMDGKFRVAFSCQAAEIAEAIERGQGEASTFGLAIVEPTPAGSAADARATRFLLEMTLALTWAWEGVEGAEGGDPDLWRGERLSLSSLVANGDPALGVPPLAGPLAEWFSGPLLEVLAEGEGFGPSPSGGGAAGPSTATGVVH